MDLHLKNVNISDKNIINIIENKININKFDLNREYDISIEYYNEDIVTDRLNEDIVFEVKSEHYRFIKNVRELIKNLNIKINNFYLLGTVASLDKGEMNVFFNYAKGNKDKENVIWPCKEIYLYDGSKKVLDSLLDSKQISLDEYNKNLAMIQDQFGVYEVEEDNGYLN